MRFAKENEKHTLTTRGERRREKNCYGSEKKKRGTSLKAKESSLLER